MSTPEQDIFKRGSTTYYLSSKFFTKKVREDVFKLYSFVRVADDYVDAIPQKADDFMRLRQAWNEALNNVSFSTDISESDTIDQRVVKNIIYVSRKYNFDEEWINSFLDSMQADIDNKLYKQIEDSLWYVYGSAEAIGLMMARILGLNVESYEGAKLQGRAMQWINFIRDIAEDIELGRCYFPESVLKQHGIKEISQKNARANPDVFNNFVRDEIDRYRCWQEAADKSYVFIPKRLRIPLQTARDMYNWTAEEIYKNPMIVFEKKLKPSKQQVLACAIKNIV